MRARIIGITSLSSAALILPLVANAAGLLDTLALFNRILNGLVGLAVLLAILGLFFGLVQYFFTAKGDDDKKKAVQMMLWGIVAIFIMVSIWGIIRLLQTTFGINPAQQAILPSGVLSF